MKLSIFQLVALGIFATCILVGVGVFATLSSIGQNTEIGRVVVWGTLDAGVIESALADLRQKDKVMHEVTYVQQESKSYVATIVNAMANGTGPDLFVLSQDQIVLFSDKIGTIPYGAVSQQTFTDSYVDEAQLFLTTEGALALPFVVNPLVLYWNRDMLASAGYANPPKYWNDFFEMAPKLTQLSGGSNIKKSAVALGGWSNIEYAKQILTTLFMQAGDPIVVRNEKGDPTPVLGVVQNTNAATNENPAMSALQFYTEFANPVKTIYSWNRSLPLSQDAFVSGDLALYFGLASDYPVLRERNQNLRFGVSKIPQIEGSGLALTFGHLYALAIPRTTKNPNGALLAAQKMTSQPGVAALAAYLKLPPARRDVAVDTSKDAALSVFIQSALIARGWLDPDPAQSDALFKDMIESVISGRDQPGIAVFNAAQVLRTLLKADSTQTP